MQVIEYCQNIFKEDGLDIYLKPYKIVSTGFQSGFIEYLEGTQSVDCIKRYYNMLYYTIPYYTILYYTTLYLYPLINELSNFISPIRFQ